MSLRSGSIVRLLSRAAVMLLTALMWTGGAAAQLAEPWDQPYTGEDADGGHVLGYWRFEAGNETADSSGRGHVLTISGAEIHSEGKFGSCLESFPGWPVQDERHAATAAHHADLSPGGAFSLEMWIQAKPDLKDYRNRAFLIDKKYVTQTDYQLILERPTADGARTLRAELGFGDDSETWHSDQPLKLEPGNWHHVAMTYDGNGTLRFYLDGVPIGGGHKPGRRGIAPGRRPLSIGDRGGSYHAGFSGYIDEVRLTSGVREFRAMSLADENRRRVFLRGEPRPRLTYRITNHYRQPLDDVRATFALPNVPPHGIDVGRIEPGESRELEYPFETSLRPDEYELSITVTAAGGERELFSEERFPVTLVARQSPHRMPVVMWGIGGIDSVTRTLPKLKRIGFTHCLGLRCDYGAVWEAGEPILPTSEENLESAAAMLDEALANDLSIVASLSPGRWLASKKEYQRIDREGKPHSRENLANVSPDLETFFFNVGASVAKAWGDHPALQAALVSTEVRDGTAPSFHPQEREAFRDFAGFDIPEQVQTSRGVSWTDLDDVPSDRIVPDDHPVLVFYRWFWTVGDGWNSWHTALHRGFQTAEDRPKAAPSRWTFFDPAVRAPSIHGSGGEVDYLSHWTYTYPDPIRIGLCTDELLRMAKGSRHPSQQVMKMTQVIWYRSQTAPTNRRAEDAERSPWEDYDPDAAYITIAPMHLREALWMKLSRPVQGIMYHGWGSLVPGSTSSYRYTHPQTQHELARLIREVVEPLGPALRQIPAAPADVAMLESFSSQMLARRGTYGWGRSWAADCWHALQYAHLQTDIVYDETILHEGLDQYRVLVLPDCDVLTESVAEKIREFQRRGGILVGDNRLAPGIEPDIRLTAYSRTRQAQEDQAALIRIGGELREALADKNYRPVIDADQPDVIVHRRRAGESDYMFAINDRREYGDYVGQHKLVMEQGLQARANVSIQREGETGFVYDLRRRRAVEASERDGALHWPVTLAPGDGALFLVTSRPIERLQVTTPDEVERGKRLPISIDVTDAAGNPVDAVVPLKVEILDPDGRPAEFSGHHAYVGRVSNPSPSVTDRSDGLETRPTLEVEVAPNDVRGVWTIRVEEGAAGRMTENFVRVR